MKIIFASAHDTDSEPWIKPLQALVPTAEFQNWDEHGPTIGAQLAVVWNPPADIFLRESKLEAIFNLGAGVDALFRLPGLKDDTPIVRLEDAGMAVQMAEYAAYALLRASRQFDAYEALQNTQFWTPQPDIDRRKWPVGVMGMGVMGARVAQTLASFNYPVAGWSRSGNDLPGIAQFVGRHQLSAFLGRTRVLINTLPLTDETRGILSRQNLLELQPHAHIVNVGRGEHLIEEDLLALLDSGHIQGATLDVFRQEPLPQDHPFWRHPRITLTPHVAAASLREESIEQVAEKINRYLRGEPLTGVVARSKGY
ncbi:glyoxylate/hydroxypyruvate reductase A [Candidimonas sp. SYP-B2681]|uniref:2-hydroxyacid dehydrogenase n=1 Tax=Candidimonas sp. SYP-B2681 TaxID=2497686 RepID=UPI000F86F54F|nr:glyoxylate/hydroxypyruvate reductase A [Candidimonas sp. SYP-B2681]RTZ48156.1 glyoxylate/hydroxypyruvate reductase A [Candidimonas sp. SYP-B2681]